MALITINNETIFQFSIFGLERDGEIVTWQKKVFDKLKLPITQIYFPFEKGYGHGYGVEHVFNQLRQENKIDYIICWDIDCIPLKEGCLEFIYEKIKDKHTLFGGTYQSNHKKKPDGTFNHPYAGPPFAISSILYEKLGKPSLDHFIPRSDTFEEATWKCEELGFSVCLMWPSNVIGLNDEEMRNIPCPTSKSPLGQGHFNGFGTTYGDGWFYHQMCAPAKRHKELFVKKCNEVLNK